MKQYGFALPPRFVEGVEQCAIQMPAYTPSRPPIDSNLRYFERRARSEPVGFDEFGIPYGYQRSLLESRIWQLSPSGSSTTLMGFGGAASGIFGTAANASPIGAGANWLSTRLLQFYTANTANSVAGPAPSSNLPNNYFQPFIGDNSQSATTQQYGGFLLQLVAAFVPSNSGNGSVPNTAATFFAGAAYAQGSIFASTQPSAVTGGLVGFSLDSTDTQLQVLRNSPSSTPKKIATSSPVFQRNNTSSAGLWDMRLFAPPNNPNLVHWWIREKFSGVTESGVLVDNLPAPGITNRLVAQVTVSSSSNAAYTSVFVSNMYCDPLQ